MFDVVALNEAIAELKMVVTGYSPCGVHKLDETKMYTFAFVRDVIIFLTQLY